MFVPLLLTVIAGLFIMLGAAFVFFTKRDNLFVPYSIGMAFGVMIMLVLFELLPEASELLYNSFDKYGYIALIFFILLGGGVIKILDILVPDHCHHENIDDTNLYHIGVVSSIALILHNFIEGMSIYVASVKAIDMGILLTLGVGFHNIPMGIVLASTFSGMRGKKKFLFILILVTLSTFIGGVASMFLNSFINDTLLGVLLSLTLGMIIYIVLFELLHEIIHSKNKKVSYGGVLTGIIIFLFSMFLEV